MEIKGKIIDPVLGALLKPVLWSISRTRLPQVKGTIDVQGTDGNVEILRDRWGVAHIYAASMGDVLFGQGFVHAQERLWQMDFTRRVVSGRLAEILGEAALPVDRVMRTLGLRRAAEQQAATHGEETQTMLDRYCQGANAWIALAERKHKLPLEFVLLGYRPEPWSPADVVSWVKLMCWTLAANWQSEFYRGEIVRRLGKDKTAQLELDIQAAWAVILELGNDLAEGKLRTAIQRINGAAAGDGVGSNNWVVHGSRTVSGMPLLANDMHLEMTAPAVWYENHLSGGGLDVTGVTMPGVPLVTAGHNRSVAWALTDALPDTQDLFEEHLRQAADGSWEYEFQGQWVKAEVRKETIQIKGGEEASEEVICTRHGPIINILLREAFPEAPPLALRWTALDAGTEFEAFLKMNTAAGCSEFHEALRLFTNPSQNVVYADTQGNIGYCMNGRVPVRASGDGSQPAPGWKGEHEWIGEVPFESMPHALNPAHGYIVTANNQPERKDLSAFLGRDFLTSERAGRICEMLEARQKVDLAYIQEMQRDQISISARLLGSALGKLEVSDPELQEVVSKMRDWDGRLGVDDAMTCIFEATARQVVRLLLDRWLGKMGARVQGRGPFAGQWPEHTWEWFIHLLETPASGWFDLGNGEKRDDVLKLALRQAMEFLKEKLGPNVRAWKWGRLHQLTMAHVLGAQKPLDRILNIGPFPIGGDGNTIWASYSSWHDLERRPIVGPPFRFIADLGDLEHCWGQLIPGQSGHLASRHWRDGVQPWFKGEYHPMLFRRDEVEQHLESSLLLLPMPGKA